MSLSDNVMVGDATGNLELVDLNTLKTYIREQAREQAEQILDCSVFVAVSVPWIATNSNIKTEKYDILFGIDSAS